MGYPGVRDADLRSVVRQSYVSLTLCCDALPCCSCWLDVVPFFERANNAHFNSVAVIDADGTNKGIYRKTHIPDGKGKGRQGGEEGKEEGGEGNARKGWRGVGGVRGTNKSIYCKTCISDGEGR